MSADEEATHAQLKAHRLALVDPKIREHRGRIVKTTGDGMLVEFGSVVDAVRCAVAVQHGMMARNAEVSPERRIEFRVGINLGDVIIDGDDIHGDGVNVAARLEALADPGGVCLSRTVHDQVRDKLELVFDDIGEQQVKNIARPVHVFRIAMAAKSEGTPARPTLALPDKPSIAVLAFQNMSGDPEQEYFADGIVEDIITALSRIRWLFVIARNSSFTYKGKAVDVKQVGRELGVRYVLEGSVRKASNRVRITGQLIDAATGAHVWADRFEGPLDDIFELQDRVASSVVGVIEPALRKAEIERVRRRPTMNLDAYDLFLRAQPLFLRNKTDNEEALGLVRRAITLDPGYAIAYGFAAVCIAVQRSSGWVRPSDPILAEGVRFAKQAATLGQDDPEALAWAGFVLDQLSGEKHTALTMIERALSLNPSSAWAWMVSASIRSTRSELELALAHLERSTRLNPLDPNDWFRSMTAAYIHFHEGYYVEASAWADKAMQGAPANYPPVIRIKAAACGLLGHVEEARPWVERLLATDRHMTIATMRSYYGVFWPKLRLEAYLDGLRKAGLPE